MKKRKILFLLPVAALILSGCTFQEGWETVSGFFTNNVYEPVKGWVENLLGIKHEEKKEEKKDDQGDKEPDVAGDDDPVEVEDTVIGSIENPISVADFQTQLDALIDYAAVEENKTEVDSSHLFFVKAKVTGSTALNEYKEINFLNMVDCDDSSKQVTGYWTVVDSSITEDFSAKDSLKGREVVVKGYGALYKKVKNNQETKTYELMKKDNDHKSTLVKVYEAESKTEPEKLNKTIAEIIQCEPTKSQAYISQGIIKSWANNKGEASETKTKYGNLIITDGQNDIFVYGASGVETDLAWDEVSGEYKMSNSAAFLTNDVTKDLVPGDTVNFWGTYYKYNTTFEMDMIITSKFVEPVSSVTLDKESISLEVGQMATLEAEVLPANANQELTWEVSQTAEFISFADGKVTALAEGEATITARSVGDPTKSDSCTVTVTEATKELVNVVLSGTPKAEYTEGESYSEEGLVLTANYSDQSHEDVTEFATWQISKEFAEIGDSSIEITATYGEKSDTMVVNVTVAQAPKGSKLNPYTVAEARAAIDEGGNVTNVYAYGYVSKIVTAYNSQFGNISFDMSADGLHKGDQLQGYRTSVSSADDVAVGDKVVLYGTLKKYNSTYEFDAGNTIDSRVVKGDVASISITGTASQTEYGVDDAYNHNGLSATATFENGAKADVTEDATWAISPETASLTDTEITITATYENVVSAGFVVSVTVSQQSVPVEQIYKTVSFAAANTSDSISSYTAEGTYTQNGFSVKTANFNNNKKAWDFIKCGRKSDASVATITTSAAIDKAVSKVNITFTTYTAVTGTTAKVLVSSSANMSNATEYAFTPEADTTVSVPITTGVQNAYYQVVFDCVAHGSTNGYIWITNVSYSAIY